MKLLIYFYLGFFVLTISAKAANTSLVDTEAPVAMYASDSINRKKPQQKVKLQVLSTVSFSSAIIATILAFSGAMVGVIVLGVAAILAGYFGETLAKKITKEQLQPPSTTISPSKKVKARWSTLGMILGALAIAATLCFALINSFFNLFKLGG